MKTLLKASQPLRVSLFIFLLLSLGVGIAGYLYYLAQERDLRSQHSEELTTVVNLKVRQIINWHEERMRDARTIQLNAPVIRRIHEHLRDPSARTARDDVYPWLESFQRIKEYESILLVDPEQRVRASFGQGNGAVGEEVRARAGKALASGRIDFSDLRLGQVSQVIRWDIFVPLHLRDGKGVLPVGVVILRMDPRTFLYPLIQSWSTPSVTAETLLVRREGADVLFLNELRHRKDTALKLRLPLDDPRLPAAVAVQNREGIVEGTDYRGASVLAAMRAVPGTNMFLISKIDSDEIYEPLQRQAGMILLIVTAMIGLAGVTIILVWRGRQAESYQQLYESERARQALLRRYEIITREANDIILLADGNRRIVEVNEQALRTYGYAREELLALDMDDLRDREAPRGPSGEARDGHPEGLVFEETHRRRDGTAFPVEISTKTVDVEGGTHHLAIIRDITERRRSEEALRQTTARLDFAQSAAKAGVWDWDLATGRLEWSDRMFALFGLDPQRTEASFASWRGIVHPGDLETAERRIKEALEERITLDSDYRVILPGGGIRWINALGRGEYDGDGRPTRMVGICIDITERRRMVQLLQEAEEKYRIVAENTHDWEFWISPEGRFLYNSPSCERVTGYTARDFEAEPKLIARIVHPEDRALYHSHIRDDLPLHRPGNLTYRIVRKDGQVRWMEHVCQTVLGEDGASLGQRGSNRDVTDRKEAEGALQRRTAQVEEANRELESFSYSVSHDLRAPLRAIDGFTKMLLRDKSLIEDGETRRKLGVIRQNTQRMGQLIDDLLALSRLGRQSMNLTLLDMNVLVGEAWAEQASTNWEHEAELRVAALPPSIGDRALVRLVLVNLLSNAIKYSRKQEQPLVEITARTEGGETVYSVRDNGVGFDMQYYDQLFGVFQRLHRPEEYEGTGVGLAIVQRVIHRHEGRVWAEGIPGGGATFHFTLPGRDPRTS
jgi:PAS domain S-box-containing protein